MPEIKHPGDRGIVVLLWALTAGVVVFWIGVLYVVAHFVAKFW